MIIARTIVFGIGGAAATAGAAGPAMAQACTRQGVDVTCDDGRRGVYSGDAIIWADGTRSNLASPHPSRIVVHKPSVEVGPFVIVAQGIVFLPLETLSDPRLARVPGLFCVLHCY